MAVRQTTTSQMIGERVAAALRGREAIESVWIHEIPGMTEVYVITTDLDRDGEIDLLSAMFDVMDSLPETVFRPHILNPRFFIPGIDLTEELPRDITLVSAML